MSDDIFFTLKSAAIFKKNLFEISLPYCFHALSAVQAAICPKDCNSSINQENLFLHVSGFTHEISVGDLYLSGYVLNSFVIS